MSQKFEKQFSYIPPYFLKLTTSVTTSCLFIILEYDFPLEPQLLRCIFVFSIYEYCSICFNRYFSPNPHISRQSEKIFSFSSSFFSKLQGIGYLFCPMRFHVFYFPVFNVTFKIFAIFSTFTALGNDSSIFFTFLPLAFSMRFLIVVSIS